MEHQEVRSRRHVAALSPEWRRTFAGWVRQVLPSDGAQRRAWELVVDASSTIRTGRSVW